MKKGYLAVPSLDAEKQPWFDEKQHDSTSSSSLIIAGEEEETPWITRVLICMNHFFMSPRQKEKSTRKSMMLRSRTRGIKMLCTLIFCIISMYFIHRFIDNYIEFALPTETASDLFKSIPSSDHIKQHFNTYYASHIASSDSDKKLAEWTRDSWIEFGVTDTKIETYWPLLNYPTTTTQTRRLSLIKGPTTTLLLDNHEKEDRSLFHAYSGNGNVTGPIVYVNYGRLTDFQFLLARGIFLNGSIALIRNGVIKKGLKVKMAEDFGCIGVLLFTDPQDSFTTNDSAVASGTVQYSSYIVGDPLTQGYAASNDTHRITYDEASGIPKIPSLPISWHHALELLKSTEGFGIKADMTWLGGMCDVNYFSGPSDEAQVNLVNFNDYQVKPIWNVVGKIKGSVEPNRAIIIGNHRDGWNHDGGGAVDPSSGSAVLMELVRTIGVLIKRGWHPRRTLIIASWDAQKYGSIGSTEWVEDHQSWLQEEAIAYLNVDYAVSGKHFVAQSSPLLNQLLYQVTKEIIDPHTSKSVYDVWSASVTAAEHDFYFESSPADNASPLPLTDPLGSDSDYTAFFNHLGISSVSFGFRGTEYDSIKEDTMEWIMNIDPTFEYHQALTKIWGLLVLRLSSDIILPMHVQDYTTEIIRHISHLSIIKQGCSSSSLFPFISSALHSLSATSLHFDKRRNHWARQLTVRKHHSRKLKKHVAKTNERLLQFERAFIDPEGISRDRPWFKHVVYGPNLNTGMPQEFPGLAEAMDNDNSVYTKYIEERVGKLLLNAERTLRGQFDDFDDEKEDDKEEEDDEDY